jgi:cytochrome b561
MTTDRQQFTVSMRFLHWLMAAMVLTMLGIGVAMVVSLADYHRLVSIHRPLGIMILILVVIRFVNRRFSTLPPFSPAMSSQERFVASVSEMLLYTLFFVQPLVGWGMLSAARYPIALFGSLSFPHPSAQRDVVRGVVENAHGARLPLIPRVHRPFWSCTVSHADRARSVVQPHGAVESPRDLGGFRQTTRRLGSGPFREARPWWGWPRGSVQ